MQSQKIALRSVELGARYPAVGLPEIDGDHRRINDELQRLAAAVSLDNAIQAAKARNSLLAEVAVHFDHEERLMRQIQYADLPRHQRTHAAFLAGARRIPIRKSRADPILSSRFVRWAARIEEWFHSHMLEEDLPLGRAVLASRARSR